MTDMERDVNKTKTIQRQKSWKFQTNV